MIRLAPGLTLPVEVVTQAVAILAKRRAGKSYTARRLAEQLVKADQQIVIVDPKGDWWGIRAHRDGKGAGLPITILGGERGDVPLEKDGGELVARLVVEERVSALLDLSLFRKGEIATFMAAFLETLYRLKAREAYRTPVMLVVDEADAIAPQKPQPNEARMLGAAEDIVRRGGQRGIGCTMITQRSAVLNKNVLTQVQVLIALRTIAPQDLKALDAWIDVHGTEEQRKTLRESLPSLPVGDAWVWSPGWPDRDGIFERVHVLPIETFDSGETPKPGQKRAEPKMLADVDLDAVRRQMAGVAERAAANDPKKLRARIAQLERDMAAAVKAQVVPDLDAIDREKRASYAEGRRDAAREVAQITASATASRERAARAIDQALGQLKVAADALREPLDVPEVISGAAESRGSAAAFRAPRPVHVSPPRMNTQRSGDLSGPDQRVLDALAWWESIGVTAPSKVQVGFVAGYRVGKSVGGTFGNILGRLRSEGLIDYPAPSVVQLLDAGRAIARAPSEKPTTEALQRAVHDRLDGPESRVLATLIEAYPNAISKQEAGARSGYNVGPSVGGTFGNILGRLRSLGLIDYPAPGQVVALPVLFLEGA